MSLPCIYCEEIDVPMAREGVCVECQSHFDMEDTIREEEFAESLKHMEPPVT